MSPRAKQSLIWLIPLLLSMLLTYAGPMYLTPLLKGPSCMGDKAPGYNHEWYANWDGQWYKQILRFGYNDEKLMPEQGALCVVFFPLYPLLGRAVQAVLPLKPELCLVAVSLLALTGFCYLWRRYCELRLPGEPVKQQMALLFILFWPTSYFLRFAYTESLYMLIVCALFYGFARRWPVGWLILLSALSTAVRPTGVICAATLGLHCWRRYASSSLPARLFKTAAAMGLGLGGIALYYAFLGASRGDALMAIHMQAYWDKYPLTNWMDLITLKLVLTHIENSLPETYWHFVNKDLWLLAMGLIIIGALKRWLTAEEILFSLLSLLVFYITTRSRDMASVGRYLITVLPMYLVIARLLPEKYPIIWASLLAICAAMLVIYSSLFANWECVY